MSTWTAASALVVVRRQPQLEVLITRRADHLRAFPAQWAFPGGHHETQDADPFFPADLPDAVARQAALRELFEETGLLPGYQGDPRPLETWRDALLANCTDWASLCRALDYLPPVEALQPLGLRVSPPLTPRRFEADYFLLELPSCEAMLTPAPELRALEWLPPSLLWQRWCQGKLLCPVPVRDVLEILAQQAEDAPCDLQALRAVANDREHFYRAIEIHPGIELLPVRTPTLPPATHTNCYLVGAERFVVIDPASPFPEEQALLNARLEARTALGQRPEAILLTHHHRDHVGGAEALRQRWGLPIWAHAETAALVPFAVDRLLTDGEPLPLGTDPQTGSAWCLEVVFTPGHAPGHLCFVDSRQRVAIVGDMLAGLGSILIEPPRGHMGQYLDSLLRLRDARLLYLLPAHGPLLHDPVASCEAYLAHRAQRNQTLLRALANGPADFETLLQSVYADTAPQLLGLARGALQAHLIYLQEQGQIAQAAEKWRLV
ncbi:MAG: MBL fold metallo-hydrolase [Candidatus Sericytochromatia bacterium]